MNTFGLVAAVARARHGHSSARWYLIAISAFFLLAGASISLSRVEGHTLYIEHLGLLAVVVEAALLALVSPISSPSCAAKRRRPSAGRAKAFGSLIAMR